MKIDRFRINVIVRVLLLGITIFLLLYFLRKSTYLVTAITIGLVLLYQIYGLIRFVERTNRELSRFFESIQEDDFTQSFSGKKLGDSFDELNKSFSRVTRKFLKLRSEKEEHARYLQTVITHVGTGLISYKANGDVELLNATAKRLLNINSIKNIKALEQFSKPMVDTLLHLKAGESTSLKIESNGKTVYLSINATQFKIKDELYTLLSLQDIQPEIEREHMAKELEIAWNVQKSLLPAENPRIRGFDIAGMCQPAKEVGGDYYDFIPVGADKLAMIIGDVSGKGIPASFYMTLTKGFIQSHMTENTSPKEVLIKVNELLYNTIDRKAFVTMFIVVVDLQLKKAVYARAGHNPLIHYSGKNGEVTQIKPDGIALGLRKTGVFSDSISEYELQLENNDWLLLYTDGITEAADARGKEFGEKGLIQSLTANHDKGAEAMVAAIFKRVEDFARGADQFDDMTMVALKTG